MPSFYDNQKNINLVSVTQLWNLYLLKLKESLAVFQPASPESSPSAFPTIDSSYSTILTLSKIHEAHNRNIQQLRAEILAKMEKSKQNLLQLMRFVAS